MKLDKIQHPIISVFGNKNPHYKKFILPKRVYQEVSKIKFDREEMSDENLSTILRSLTNRESYLYIPELNSFMFEYVKTDEQISIIQYYLDKDDENLYRFYCDISLVGEPSFRYRIKEQSEPISDKSKLLLDLKMNKLFGDSDCVDFFINNMYEFLIRSMIFIDLSKDRVRFSEIKNKENFGSIVKGNQIKNETGLGITLVDSLWNITSVSYGEFKVRGHFRLQRCGVGFSQVKLIFIDEFIKTHYIRRSSRELRLN